MVLLLWLRDEVFDHGVVLHTGRLQRKASSGSLSLALAASRRASTLASGAASAAASQLSRNSVDAVLNELRGVDPLRVRCVVPVWVRLLCASVVVAPLSLCCCSRRCDRIASPPRPPPRPGCRLDAWIAAAGKQLQWSRDEARL